jgi:hypothetical protein
MKKLPKKIKFRFYSMLVEKQSIIAFEKWVYESKELEETIDEDSHLDFISLNYNSSGAYYELKKLIENQIDKVDFSKWKFITELNKVRERKGNYHLCIMSFYDLYCKGYGFMDKLAFNYGLTLVCPYSIYGVESYEELNQKERDNIVENFYPKIIIEIDKVLNWLNNNEIILQETTNEFGLLEYVDLRIEDAITYPITKEKENKKKWWKFW